MGRTVRPPLLEALCILSFIGNGIAFLVYFVAAIFNQPARKWICELSSVHDTSKLNSVYFILFTLLYLISFTGVLKMWKLKKAGFFCYAGAQIVILFLPSLWLGNHSFSVVAFIFTFFFVALFASQARRW